MQYPSPWPPNHILAPLTPPAAMVIGVRVSGERHCAAPHWFPSFYALPLPPAHHPIW